MPKFHNTVDGPKPCTASERACPVGGSHFESQSEAQAAYEKTMGEKEGVFTKLKKAVSGARNPATAHIAKAESRIEKLQKDFSARDARQGVSTTYRELLSQGVSQDDLQALTARELSTRQATVGLVKTEEGADPIVGVLYTGDYRAEEEYGIAHISKALREGSYGPDDIYYTEDQTGFGYFIAKGERSYDFDAAAARNMEPAKKRASIGEEPRERDRLRWELSNNLKATELRERAKDHGIKPLPSTKDQLVQVILDVEAPGESVTTPAGEFSNGDVLVIASDNPTMKAVMTKAAEAHKTGDLRMANSSNPFSRGVVFYDDRDVTSSAKADQIREEEALLAAEARIQPVWDRLKSGGSVFAVSPSVDGATTDVSQIQYWLNYAPKSRPQIFGWYNENQLNQIADGDFSPTEK